MCYNVITVKGTEKSLKPERRIIMKKNYVTYWTVKANGIGWNGVRDLYFHEYKNAKAESIKDYRDNPVKHTVKPETFAELNPEFFED